MSQGMIRVQPGSVKSEYRASIEKGVADSAALRVMKRDASLFTTDSTLAKLIANRLGWVDVAAKMKRQVPAIERFGNDALRTGIKHVVLVGMGGSSLCPELFALMFGKHKKLTSFDVLDSTDPAAILGLQKRINLKKTLFIIASKSGGTVETRSHEAYFLDKVTQLGVKVPGRQFVAITDKGSSLESFAKQHKYRK
ncbi:transaldolase, partial [candidate division GN15 bacterium]